MVITRKDFESRIESRRLRKLQLRRNDHPLPSAPVYVCVDWGASRWRQYSSDLGGGYSAESSIAVLNKTSGEILTGTEAYGAYVPSDMLLRFDNLKAVFDSQSDHLKHIEEEVKRHGITITIENILEKWWWDRFGSLLWRTSPNERITFAVAHPASFDWQSVQNLKQFFAKSRDGRNFNVNVSEEATAALHGIRYSGIEPDHIVVVLDGGKSTIDCACLKIVTVKDSLTTMIIKTLGLPVGGDFVNQQAKQYVTEKTEEYKDSIEGRELPDSFWHEQRRIQEMWWEKFESSYKRNLSLARQESLLDCIGSISVLGLINVVEEASNELANRTKRLLERMIQETQDIKGTMPDRVICLGGYCQSKELRSILSCLEPMPTFEKNSDGNDVISGLQCLALKPELAAWQFAPQNYLITQNREDDTQEALLLYRQGDRLAKEKHRVQILSPNEFIKKRKRKWNSPYHEPGHLVVMDVWLDTDHVHQDEPILYSLEIRTADYLKTHRNSRGFQVSELQDTSVLRSYTVTLPKHYHQLFARQQTIKLYVCIVCAGQDIILKAIRPTENVVIPDIEWMTLPEVLGTYGESAVEVFKTSVEITTASLQFTATERPE